MAVGVKARRCSVCGGSLARHVRCFCGQLAGAGHQLKEVPCTTCAGRIERHGAIIPRYRESSRRYYLQNSERLRASARERMRLRRQTDSEAVQLAQQKWLEIHREANNATMRAWRAANPEKVREYNRRYHARRRVAAAGVKQGVV